MRKSACVRAVLAALLAAALLGSVPAGAAGTVSYRAVPEGAEEAAYTVVEISGLTPRVFVPAGATSDDPGGYTSVTDMMRRWGKRLGVAAAVNAGIFYSVGPETQYCFGYREPDGVVISGGVVLKSTESIDHSECDILVVDEDGGLGWADYWADADALVAGTGVFHDMHGEPVEGKRVVSAVTGFVPIVVGGRSLYDPEDLAREGYDNFVGHYAVGAIRQVIGARADGTYLLITNNIPWTLADAAKAALAEGCVFAYNLDGGSSAGTIVGKETGASYAATVLHAQPGSGVPQPTFIVFTWNDEAPAAPAPRALDARLPGRFRAGVTLAELAAAAVVTETLENPDGSFSTRRLYSAQSRDGAPIRHTVIGGSWDISECEVKGNSVSPSGSLYYVKNEEDTSLSLLYHRNTRLDGSYYDYSTGFVLSTADDLGTPGEKTLLVSYVPGADLPALTAEVRIILE